VFYLFYSISIKYRAEKYFLWMGVGKEKSAIFAASKRMAG
jgi:hypothetical protein